MRALVLGPEGLVLRDDVEAPVAGPGDALIRLRLAGICSTDLELVEGYYDFRGVLGHELVGEVVAVGDGEAAGDGEWVGRRVVGSINLGCGSCSVCTSRGPEHCPDRTVLGIAGHDGAFAERLVLPVANLLAVPDGLADEEAVFTEPLAAALRLRQQLADLPLEPATARIAVVGPGRLGLLIAQVLALDLRDDLTPAPGTAAPAARRRHVTVLGRRPESLVLPAGWGLATGLAAEAESDAFDLVVEATGNEQGLVESLRLVRPLGTLALKSTFAGAPAVDLTKLVVGEITVVGSRCGPFAPALGLLAQGAVEVRPMIAAEYPLGEAVAAMEHAARPGVLKVLLRPGGG